MEDTLGEYNQVQPEKTVQCGLNPCFNGRYSRRI